MALGLFGGMGASLHPKTKIEKKKSLNTIQERDLSIFPLGSPGFFWAAPPPTKMDTYQMITIHPQKTTWKLKNVPLKSIWKQGFK